MREAPTVGQRMLTLRSTGRVVLGAVAIACCGLLLLTLPTTADAKRRKFKQKECLDCHDEFVEEYLSKDNIHEVVQDRKCDTCHLRHGIVGKLLLKETRNELCYECHSIEDMKLDVGGVHTALKRESCVACHNPHASDSPYLLSAEGNAICFQCHEEENYTKQVQHEVVEEEGCRGCHFAHASPEANLLVDPPGELCESCHESGASSFEKAHAGYPVQERGCAICHDPHSSTVETLLKESAHDPMVSLE